MLRRPIAWRPRCGALYRTSGPAFLDMAGRGRTWDHGPLAGRRGEPQRSGSAGRRVRRSSCGRPPALYAPEDPPLGIPKECGFPHRFVAHCGSCWSGEADPARQTRRAMGPLTESAVGVRVLGLLTEMETFSAFFSAPPFKGPVRGTVGVATPCFEGK